MSNVNEFTQSFAGGEIGAMMVARLGVESYQASGALYENFLPLAQGPMTRRNGTQYIDSWNSQLPVRRILKHSFDVGSNYLISPRPLPQYTSNAIPQAAIYVDDGLLMLPETQPAAWSAFTDASGLTSSVTPVGPNYINLNSLGANAAIARFHTTVRDQDVGVVHVATLTVFIGNNVTVKFGSAAGNDDLGTFSGLSEGNHQLEFQNLYHSSIYMDVTWIGSGKAQISPPSWLYNSPAGTGPVPYTFGFQSVDPYTSLNAEPNTLRTAQDGNRLWLFDGSGNNVTPRIVERRGAYSWSTVWFQPPDGPFSTYGDTAISVAPSDINGVITLSVTGGSSSEVKDCNAIRLFQPGQTVKEYASSQNYFSQPIKVTGIGSDRKFQCTITGTSFVGTVNLQRSLGSPNQFTNVLSFVNPSSIDESLIDSVSGNDLYTASQATGTWDNTVVYYRLCIGPNNYTSGSVELQLTTAQGSTVGVARNLARGTTSAFLVTSPFASATPTNVWQAAIWGNGAQPQCGCFGKGRLVTAAGREVITSNSDNFFSFTDGVGSDSPQAPNTSIDAVVTSKSSQISWLACLDFLCLGTLQEELVGYSDTPTQPMQPGTFVADFMTQEGGAPIDPLTLSYAIIFVHRTGRKLYMFAHNLHSLSQQAFTATDLTRLHPEMARSGIVRIAATEEPERRIYCVLGDGTARTLLFRMEEQITAWSRVVTTIGKIVDVAVLKESDEDRVYFLIENPGLGGTYDYTLVRMLRELPVNPWLNCFLDNFVATPFQTGVGGVRPSALTGSVSLFFDAIDDYGIPQPGMVLWLDGGRILIDTAQIVSAYTADLVPYDTLVVTGTVLSPLTGIEAPDGEIVPYSVNAANWMIAQQTSEIVVPARFAGQTFSVYADLGYLGDFVVPSNGVIALPAPASRIVAGLPLTARWQSLKLAYGAQKGTAVLQKKRCIQLGLILDSTGEGLQMGGDFQNMEPVILESNDVTTDLATPFFTGEINLPFNGEFDTDPRICFRMDGPQPCTIAGYVANVETHER